MLNNCLLNCNSTLSKQVSSNRFSSLNLKRLEMLYLEPPHVSQSYAQISLRSDHQINVVLFYS